MINTEVFKMELAADLRIAAMKRIGQLGWSYRELAVALDILPIISRDILESHVWTLEQAIAIADVTGVQVEAS